MSGYTASSNTTVVITRIWVARTVTWKSRWRGFFWVLRALPSLFRPGSVTIKNPRVVAQVIYGRRAVGV